MNIFNWVHRKFHHRDGKKEEFVANNGTEKQVLLEHVAPAAKVFDGWRDGAILTIGTFGFDPWTESPNHRNHDQFCIGQKAHEEQGENEVECDDDEELLVDDDGLLEENGMKECVHEDEEDTPLVPREVGSGSIDDENALAVVSEIYEVADFELEDGKMMMNQKNQRTTLADLFAADTDIIHRKNDRGRKPLPGDFDKKKKKQQRADDVDTIKEKGWLSFAKKLIPRAGEDARPIKKLSKLMRRRLKRKIHPDFEGKFQKMQEISQSNNPTH